MAEPLDLDRFRELAEAYGGEIRRWPDDVRASARLVARNPQAAAILAEAAALDDKLAAWRTPLPSPGFRMQTSAGGLKARSAFGQRIRLWWAGIGLAAALSGAAAGSIGAATFLPLNDHGETNTFFGDVSDAGD
jgi:hypothetical protein